MGFWYFSAAIVLFVIVGSATGLFRRLAANRWGLAPGETLVDMFTIARALKPLTPAQSALLTLANVVGIFGGFQVGRAIELMTMVVTDRRVIWALEHGDATGRRTEFSPAQPAELRVVDGDPGYRCDGVHESRIVALSAQHLDGEQALVLPTKFLDAPPPWMRVQRARA